MKILNKKKEELVKKELAKILVHADSLYYLFNSIEDNSELIENPNVKRHFEYDIKELREVTQRLFWKGL